MSLNGACGQCDGEPTWRVFRRGDAVCSWACDEHLVAEFDALQRDYEITELVVTHSAKAAEVAEINRSLRAIADGAQ